MVLRIYIDYRLITKGLKMTRQNSLSRLEDVFYDVAKKVIF